MQPAPLGGECAPEDHMREMKLLASTLGSVTLHWYATASREVWVSMPPTRYPFDAGLQPSHPKRVFMAESKPASKGPAIVVPTGNEV